MCVCVCVTLSLSLSLPGDGRGGGVVRARVGVCVCVTQPPPRSDGGRLPSFSLSLSVSGKVSSSRWLSLTDPPSHDGRLRCSSRSLDSSLFLREVVALLSLPDMDVAMVVSSARAGGCL